MQSFKFLNFVHTAIFAFILILVFGMFVLFGYAAVTIFTSDITTDEIGRSIGTFIGSIQEGIDSK